MATFNEFITYMRSFNEITLIVRLGLALFLGGLIGLERERKRRPAGFRTHMLVCLGSALTILISQYLQIKGLALDVTRLAAQVISGIGFLGAGTIIVTGRQQVKGLTTAAGLWSAACMGLAIGIGFYEGALLTCVVMIVANTVFTRMERKLLATARTMNIYVQFNQSDDVSQVIAMLKEKGLRIIDVEITKMKADRDIYPSAMFLVDMRKKIPHTEILAALAGIDGIRSVEEL